MWADPTKNLTASCQDIRSCDVHMATALGCMFVAFAGLVCVGGLCSRPYGITKEITKGGMIGHGGYPKTPVKFFSDVSDMVALGLPEGQGSSQLLTGVFERRLLRSVESEPEFVLDLWTQVGL